MLAGEANELVAIFTACQKTARRKRSSRNPKKRVRIEPSP
jgi:hypothetical protein